MHSHVLPVLILPDQPARSCQRLGRALRTRVPKKLPLLLPLLFALLLLSNFLTFSLFGFNFSGWSWVILVCVSLGRLLCHGERVRLPLLIWAPWSALVLAYTFAGYEYAWQSTAQILCPIAVGAAVSTYSFDTRMLQRLNRTIRVTFWILLACIALIVVPFSLADIENSGWAAGAVSLLFFQAWFLSSYMLDGRRRLDLFLYLSAVAVPVLGANRGPMLASVALVVFSVLPIRLSRRVVICGAAVVLGIAAFHLPKVQNKMFVSGYGELQDLNPDNPNLRTNGRMPMWGSLKAGIADAPGLGHGGNADRTWLLEHGFVTYLPHNDWLRVVFNYGWLGAGVFALALIAQMLHACARLASGTPLVRVITAAGISCFVPFAVMMYTDNVLIYCQYFTVPMMAMVGIAYARVAPDEAGRLTFRCSRGRSCR